MTESQRDVVPRSDGGELDTALAFLRFARRCMIKKLDGLTEEQARRAMVPSGTSLAGLVRHAIDGEQFWFGTHLIGVGAEPDWDAHMTPDPAEPIEVLVERYRTAAADADTVIERLGDADTLSVGVVDGQRKTLRWTLAHVTGETTRHAGHADILRELIDGTTGR